MFNVAAYGVNPEQLKTMQEVTKHIQVTVRRSLKQGQFRAIFTTDGHPQAQEAIPGMVGKLTGDLLGQLYTIFAMKGELVDVD